MKKMNAKIAFLGLLSVFLLGILVISCSKDDDNNEPGTGSINVAVGTYKGKLSIRPGGPEFFDAVLNVAKVDDQHVKITAKAGEPYSNITEKTMKVSAEGYNGNVYSVIGELQGAFSYYAETKTLDVTTQKQSETDVYYYFEGTKQ